MTAPSASSILIPDSIVSYHYHIVTYMYLGESQNRLHLEKWDFKDINFCHSFA
jgi:hypothetical protein